MKLSSTSPEEFKAKVRSLLKHMYDNGGQQYHSFDWMPVRDYTLVQASDANEFERLIDFAQANGWLTWEKKSAISGGRTTYQSIHLTRSGVLEVEQDTHMMFDAVHTCPLTGLPVEGRVSFQPYNGSKQVLYTFKPIGSALFELTQMMDLINAAKNEGYKPRIDIAGICREAAERGQAPVVVTNDMIYSSKSGIPHSFSEKSTHFLRLLSETGGIEYKKRDLSIHDDFPLAFAENANEFHRILESLIAKEKLSFDKPNDSLNAWPNGIRTHYYGVLLTAMGEQDISISLAGHIKPAIRTQPLPDLSIAALHPTVQQTAGRLFADGHYRQALLDTYIALDKAVQSKAQQSASLTGKTLMDTVFSPKSPILKLADDQNEQLGFMQLFGGAVQAVRNHYAHNLSEIDDQQALEWLFYASALLRKVDEAQFVPRPPKELN